MNWFRRNLIRFGVFSAATVIGVTVSTVIAQPQADALGSPECIYGTAYLAPTAIGPNGGYLYYSWNSVPNEADGSFVSDQHVAGGVYRSVTLPAYDNTNSTGYLTIMNIDTVSHNFSGWVNLLIFC